MEQKRKGTLPGIFGRLGDLGAIDEKYDGAVSTACGPLDNVVVDTVDTAQKCIQFLKQSNLGVATFIALEKQVSKIVFSPSPIRNLTLYISIFQQHLIDVGSKSTVGHPRKRSSPLRPDSCQGRTCQTRILLWSQEHASGGDLGTRYSDRLRPYSIPHCHPKR